MNKIIAAAIVALSFAASAHAGSIQDFVRVHGNNSPYDHALRARQIARTGGGCNGDVVRAGGFFIGGTFYPVQCTLVRSAH